VVVTKQTTSSSHFDVREVVVARVVGCQNHWKVHLQLAYGCKGGGGGGRGVIMTKNSTYSSLLDAREEGGGSGIENTENGTRRSVQALWKGEEEKRAMSHGSFL